MNKRREFPLFIKISPKDYYGFINIYNVDHQLSIHLPRDNCPMSEAELRGSWRLQQLLQPFLSEVQKSLKECFSVEALLTELQNFLDHSAPVSAALHPAAPKLYVEVLHQLEEIGWEKVDNISSDLFTFHLVAEDSSGREHSLTVQLSKHFPEQSPKTSADLPEPFIPLWNKTLTSLYQEFLQALAKYQELWETLDELDKSAWVLDPPLPCPRRSLNRRLALGENTSLCLELNLSEPRDLPAYRFLGPEILVGPLREKFQKNAHLWNPVAGLVDNLETLLGQSLPSPQLRAFEDLNLDCGICYAYRYEDELPDKHCEDAKCRRPFHQSCLYEWLKMLPSSRHSFNTVFGTCPYCEKPITCPTS